jgi:Ankyrin repeats (3 copies)
MPKKSSKKSSRASASTTLVPHTGQHLAALLERAKGGRRSDVQQYLNAGGSPNVLVQVEMSGSARYTVPLLCGIMMSESASQRDTTDSVRLLLQAGAAVDATFIDHAQEEQNALLLACNLLGDLTIVQILLAAGADPCYQTCTGATALHRAVEHGHASLCRALVAASSGRTLELEVTNGRLTPLIAACAYKQEAVAVLLCTLGADINHTDSHGFTALAAAANEGCDDSLLRFLLQQRGVNISTAQTTRVTQL